jgi:hypothetical protein
MKRLVVMHLVTIFCVGAALPAHAHHSHGAIYDLCKSVTVGGRIESVQWKNPHTWFDSHWTRGRRITSNGRRCSN